MRKLLIFLVLLGAGLAILAWLERTARPTEGGAGGETDGVPTAPPAGGETGLTLRGRAEATIYDPETNRAFLHLESEDSATEGGVDRFLGVDLLLYDQAGGDVAELDAREARLRRRGEEDDLAGFRPDYERRAELAGVEAQLNAGVPVTPLFVVTPAAVIDAEDPRRQKLESGESIAFHSVAEEEGTGLGGGGVGYVIDVDSSDAQTEGGGSLEIARAGWVEFRRPGKASARFTSRERGPLTVHREPTGEVVLFASEGASLDISGDEHSSLTADGWIRLRGIESEGNVFAIEELEAQDNVVWNYGENEFRCDRATMEFDEQDNLVHARLERLPSARLALRVDEEMAGGAAPSDPVAFAIQGDDVIELFREEGLRFRVDGPADVETQGVRLRSNGEVTGRLSADQSTADFDATGGVVVERENATLETADFALASTVRSTGVRVVAGRARGGARLVGTLSDGRTFTVTSPDRLDTERTGDALRVVEGVDVDISVEGENGFRAHADRLSDFEVDALTFTAEGDVTFEGPNGRTRGERMVSHGPGRFTLSGSPEAKATFEGPVGRAEARVIDRDGRQTRARGDVVADLVSLPEAAVERIPEVEFDRYHLEADDVLFHRTERDPAGGAPQSFWLEAQGNVKSRIVTGERTFDVQRCGRLTAERIERGDGRRGDGSWIESTSRLHLERTVEVDMQVERGTMHLACDELDFERTTGEGGAPTQELVARGSVRFRGTADVQLRGKGEILTLDAQEHGRLEAPVARQVELFGILPSSSVPFRLTAQSVDFSADEIDATLPDIFFRNYHARAQRMVATTESLDLIDSVAIAGTTSADQPWTMNAGRVRLEGRAAADPDTARLSAIDASGGVDFTLGLVVRATGERLVGGRAPGILRLTGSPARIEAPLAHYEAEWIEFDPVLQIVVSTGRGRIQPVAPVQASGGVLGPLRANAAMQGENEEDLWSLEFLSSSTLVEPDHLIYILQEPLFKYKELDTTLRASWSVLWIDRLLWEELPEQLESGEPPAPEYPVDPDAVGGPMHMFFRFVQTTKAGHLVREAYFEGPVEVLTGEDVVAHADAVYLDMVSGHGWLANATVNIVGRLVGQDFDKITVKADWLRHSADGSLRADSATVTPCTFDEPHVKVVTGDLRLTPTPGRNDRFAVELNDNRIHFAPLTIPLPPIKFDTDEDLKPLWPSFSIANSARFGQLLGFGFSGSADRVAEPIAEALGAKEKNYSSDYSIDAQYLGSRGGLLDFGFALRSKKRFWLDAVAGVVYDTGDDKGFIRVEDHDDLRLWLRSNGWFEAGRSRLGFAYSEQSDLAVQSEFWEDDFVRYERDETYLQWKRAAEETFVQASVKVRRDSFRSDVEELPAASGFRGRAPLFHLGSLPVLHTGTLAGAYLRRREGNSPSEPPSSPFGLPPTFPDGLGDRETVRFDTTQVVEVPVPIGLGGMKLTPFASATATWWDESVDPDEPASRLVAEAGARLGTTFWKRGSGGSVHLISPYAEYRNELEHKEEETPVVYDEVERAVFGDFIEVGVRSRFGQLAGRSKLDIDLRGQYATHRSDGEPDGWLPVEAFGRIELEGLGRLFDIWHDGRYDFQAGHSVYALSALGTRLGDRVGIQVGHQTGRDSADQRVFDAVYLAGFYRWTDKWEFEGRDSFSLLENTALGLGFILRRYGHDMIFDLEIDVREGEGTSVSFGLEPRLTYRPSRIGYLDW